MDVDGGDPLCFLGILLLLGKFGAFFECFLFQKYLFLGKKLPQPGVSPRGQGFLLVDFY
jgi:hypothetical protein